MKTLCTRFLVTLLTLVVVVGAWAYRPGPEVIRECPQCRMKLVEQTTMSGNTFGGQLWTDGRMVAPMFPDRPWLVKCPKCKALFWIDEAKKLGNQSPWEGDKKKWPSAVRPDAPTESDFLQLLVTGSLTNEKELYARRNAWWLANDTARNNAEAPVTYSPEQEKNLWLFVNLLDESEPDQRIMKAEVYRELGQFHDCISLLSNPFENQQQARVASIIRALAAQNIRIVHEITKENKSGKSGAEDVK